MDELSPGARSLLQAADTFDDPSAEDALRVKRAVMMRVGAIGVTAAVITAGSTQAKAASVMSIAVKLTAALAVTAGGVAATWSYVNHAEPAAAVSTPAPLKAAAKPAERAPEPVIAQLPSAAPDDLEIEEPPAIKGRRTTRAVRQEPEKTDAKPELAAADLEAEMKLIRGADAALRAGRATEALALLARHQAEHPRASLAQEREGLRAIAQCQVGVPGATVAAERFVAHSPRSPLAPRMKSACKLTD